MDTRPTLLHATVIVALAAPLACGGKNGGAVEKPPEKTVAPPPTQVSDEAVREWLDRQQPTGEGNFIKGQVEYRKGNFEKALVEFEMAVKLDPEKPGYWVNYGLTHYQLGRYAEAEAAIREAIRRAPGWAEAHYNLALALDRQGKTRQALAACKRCLTLDALDFDARKLYAILEEKSEGRPPGGAKDAEEDGAKGDEDEDGDEDGDGEPSGEKDEPPSTDDPIPPG